MLSTWNCPETIPRDHALEDPKQTQYWRTAHGTVFTVLPLSNEIDWGANSTTSELLLECTYKRSEFLCAAKLLLEHCKREIDTPIIAEKAAKKEWKQHIK
eukprot:12046533-Ditylum_brightwellii.AAC.1